MDRQARRDHFRVLSGAVLLMAGLIAISLVSTRPSLPVDEADPMSSRSPASILAMSGRGSHDQRLIERTLLVEMPCRPQMETQVGFDIKQIRLKGRTCMPENRPQETEITNLSNGARATVFTERNGEYTSDYIHLSEGENHLAITMVGASGEKRRQDLVIKR